MLCDGAPRPSAICSESSVTRRALRRLDMRLWTLHPKYLDSRGLVAVWREALLAKCVLDGRTRGYRRHPQLVRFRTHPEPLQAIDGYLRGIYEEAERRGYVFDRSKLDAPGRCARMPETAGQLQHEWRHLLEKLRVRAPDLHRRFRGTGPPDPHPLFRVVAGGVRNWEKSVPVVRRESHVRERVR